MHVYGHMDIRICCVYMNDSFDFSPLFYMQYVHTHTCVHMCAIDTKLV